MARGIRKKQAEMTKKALQKQRFFVFVRCCSAGSADSDGSADSAGSDGSADSADSAGSAGSADFAGSDGFPLL